jgi:branched-chain amino acid transport system permease protein
MLRDPKRIIAYIITLAFLLTFPFLLEDYPLHLVNISGIWIILALGLGLLQGYIGEISMGHAAFFGIGAYTSVLLTMNGGFSFWLTLPISALITMVFGFLIGIVSLRLRGPYFAICTLGFGEIIRLIFVNCRELTGGPDGITGIASPNPIPLPFIGCISFTTKQANYFMIYVLVFFTVFIVYRIINSRLGKAIMAIREDQAYSECMGINAMKYKRLVFTISTFFAGIAGCLFAHYTHFISPYSFTVSQSFDLVIMVIVGGMGTIIGPILGAIILTLLPELLHAIKDYRMVIYGLMLMVIIIYFPHGIAGILKDFWDRFFKSYTNLRMNHGPIRS